MTAPTRLGGTAGSCPQSCLNAAIQGEGPHDSQSQTLRTVLWRPLRERLAHGPRRQAVRDSQQTRPAQPFHEHCQRHVQCQPVVRGAVGFPSTWLAQVLENGGPLSVGRNTLRGRGKRPVNEKGHDRKTQYVQREVVVAATSAGGTWHHTPASSRVRGAHRACAIRAPPCRLRRAWALAKA